MTLVDPDPVLAYLKEFRESVDEFRASFDEFKASVEKRFDKLETHLAQHDSRFDAIDARLSLHNSRFDTLDARINLLGTELVHHMELLHMELAGRVADLEGSRGNGGGPALTN